MVVDIDKKKKKKGFMDRAEDVAMGIHNVASNIPLVGGVFKGAEKLAHETIKATGIGTPEQVEASRQKLDISDKPIYKDPHVYEFAGAATLGVGGALVKSGKVALPFVSKLAPNMAKFTSTGGIATITRTATTIGRFPKTMTTQRAFNVSTKTSEALAKQMLSMDKIGIKDVARQGLKFALKHKKLIGGITGAEGLATWYAVDNISTMASLSARDVANNVRNGSLNYGEGVEILEEAEADANFATRTAKIITATNPLLFPFYPLIAKGANSTKRQIELQKRILGIE